MSSPSPYSYAQQIAAAELSIQATAVIAALCALETGEPGSEQAALFNALLDKQQEPVLRLMRGLMAIMLSEVEQHLARRRVGARLDEETASEAMVISYGDEGATMYTPGQLAESLAQPSNPVS